MHFSYRVSDRQATTCCPDWLLGRLVVMHCFWLTLITGDCSVHVTISFALQGIQNCQGVPPNFAGVKRTA